MDEDESLRKKQNAFTGKAITGSQEIDPEFVDLDGLRRGFAIKRSLAYVLLNEGKIKGISLRRRGRQRGKRLFSVDSVRTYLRSQMEGGATIGGGQQ
jgi:hypothetical protein